MLHSRIQGSSYPHSGGNYLNNRIEALVALSPFPKKNVSLRAKSGFQ